MLGRPTNSDAKEARGLLREISRSWKPKLWPSVPDATLAQITVIDVEAPEDHTKRLASEKFALQYEALAKGRREDRRAPFTCDGIDPGHDQGARRRWPPRPILMTKPRRMLVVGQ